METGIQKNNTLSYQEVTENVLKLYIYMRKRLGARWCFGMACLVPGYYRRRRCDMPESILSRQGSPYSAHKRLAVSGRDRGARSNSDWGHRILARLGRGSRITSRIFYLRDTWRRLYAPPYSGLKIVLGMYLTLCGWSNRAVQCTLLCWVCWASDSLAIKEGPTGCELREQGQKGRNSGNRVKRAGVASGKMQKIVQNYGLVSSDLMREAIRCRASSDCRVIMWVLVTISDICMLLLKGLYISMQGGYSYRNHQNIATGGR